MTDHPNTDSQGVSGRPRLSENVEAVLSNAGVRIDCIDGTLLAHDKAEEARAGITEIREAFAERHELRLQREAQAFVASAHFDEVEALKAELATLRAQLDAREQAVRSLYFSAVWSPDRPVDEAAIWEAVRDTHGFEPGASTDLLHTPTTAPENTEDR